MRITSMTPRSLPSPDAGAPAMLDAQIDEALLETAQGQMKADGAAAIRMIDAAAGPINRPLSEGPVGRLINIKV